jgi:protease PrsW
MPQFAPLLIAPIFFILLVLLARSGMENRTWNLFVSSFFFGMLAAVPTILAVYLVKEYWLGPLLSIRRVLFLSFAVIGFLAEIFKFLFLRFRFVSNDEITKPFDGILYALLISLGYSTVAGLFFYFNWDFTYSGMNFVENQINLNTLLYTLPFANIMFAVILGFFTGMSKFRTSNSIDALTGLAAAILFQGFYNFCLFTHDYVLLGLVGFGTLIITVMLGVKSFNTNVDSLI